MSQRSIRVAIIDMYDGHPNQGMRGFHDILKRYKEEQGIDLQWDVFDARKNGELPDMGYHIYISTGGPGSPIDSLGEEWDNEWCRLIDALHAHNGSDNPAKKYVFFVCHSFQLLCRHWHLGKVCLRNSPSFGTLPVHTTAAGRSEELFEDLPDPFYAVDSRKWQVISPDMERIEATGATILALEKERPHVPLEQCIMAIRFNEYFFGTQFHPEADPEGMLLHLHNPEKKKEVIDEHGLEKYEDMLTHLEDPDKIRLTQRSIIPGFLTQAIAALKNVHTALPV